MVVAAMPWSIMLTCLYSRYLEVARTTIRSQSGPILIDAAIFDRHAVNKHAVHRAVALKKGRRVGARELAVGVVQGFGRQFRVEAKECSAQPAFEPYLSTAQAMGSGSPATHAATPPQTPTATLIIVTTLR